MHCWPQIQTNERRPLPSMEISPPRTESNSLFIESEMKNVFEYSTKNTTYLCARSINQTNPSILTRVQHAPPSSPSHISISSLAHRLRHHHLAALGQSAPSFSPLGGVKPHTLDTYWAAAGTAAAARRQVNRGRVEWQ